jgi:hypothetical protein
MVKPKQELATAAAKYDAAKAKAPCKPAVLHLNLKRQYFDEIKAGTKTEEYRLCTSFWRNRLAGRTYDTILIKCGYPKNGDQVRIIERPWRGCCERTITHPHFGQEPVEVFAILVN